MSHQKNQKQVELHVFHEFSQVWQNGCTIQSRDPPEPDILCECKSGETVAFELVSCEDVWWDGSPVEKPRNSGGYVNLSFCDRIKRKLRNNYVSDYEISLLAYSYTVTPDEFSGTETDAKLVALLASNGLGPFDRIYVFGRRCLSIIFDSAKDM